MAETQPSDNYDNQANHEASNKAETLGQQIFKEGAGYMYGTLTNLRRYSTETTTGNQGHDWGFPFIKGVRYLFGKSTESTELSDVLGDPVNGTPPKGQKYGSPLITPQIQYDISRKSGHTTQLWFKERSNRKTKSEPTGKVEPVGKKPLFGKQQTRQVMKEVPITYKNFSVPEDWIKYTFSGRESDERQRWFKVRIVVPPHLAEQIDNSIVEDPTMAFAIAKVVCKEAVGEDVLGTTEDSQIRVTEPTQLLIVDKTFDKEHERLLPLNAV